MKLSAIIIAKNNENLIVDCLESVSFCDEIVVVDAGSTDRTRDVAKTNGAEIVESDSISFAELRNVGLKKATGDWVFYIDTDERVTPKLKESIELGIRNYESSGITTYKVNRKNFYFGDHEWPYIEKLERLFRKESLKGWHGDLHESPKFQGKVGELGGFLLHYTHRNLREMVEKTLQWSKVEAQLRFDAHHPPMAWWRFPRVMLTAFLDSYVRQKGYKAGTIGLIESMYQSFSIFITYARLWELQNKRENAKVENP